MAGGPRHRLVRGGERVRHPRHRRFFVNAIFQRDYGIIMAVTLLFAVAIAVMNLVVDVAYAWIDPRIRVT